MKTIHINQCTQEDLEWLPGIGPATAKKVVAARPIADVGELQQLIPPSAWLRVEGAGVEFDFGDGAELAPEKIEELQAALREVLMPVQPPITLLQPQPLTLRRVMPGQALKQGASYLCVWNMRWGPDGAAHLPRDAAVQVEIETGLQQHNIGIQFAHYAASVYVKTNSYGPVPVLLFEIIEETQDADNQGDITGD